MGSCVWGLLVDLFHLPCSSYLTPLPLGGRKRRRKGRNSLSCSVVGLGETSLDIIVTSAFCIIIIY